MLTLNVIEDETEWRLAVLFSLVGPRRYMSMMSSFIYLNEMKSFTLSGTS